MPPTTGPAPAQGFHTRALLGFAALAQRNNPEFAEIPRCLTAGGRAVQIGQWTIAVDEAGPPSRHFGQYGICDPRTRCVGCLPHCPSEAAAIALSRQADDSSSLWVEARGFNGDRPIVVVRSYVPGKPEQSDLWVPTLCAMSGRLHLFATNGERRAMLQANGDLAINVATTSGESVSFAAAVFARVLKSLITGAPVTRTTAPVSEAIMAGGAR